MSQVDSNDKAPLIGVNASDRGKVLPGVSGHSMEADEAASKKKRNMIIAGIIGVVVLVVVLIIVLSGGSDDDSGGDKPGPGPGPKPTPIPSGYNLYNVDQASVITENSIVTGILDVQDGPPSDYQKQNAKNGGLEVDPSKIPLGANNQKLPKIAFEFGQSDFYTTYLHLTDESNSRFSIPEMYVPKPKNNGEKRLEMGGFKLFDKPFGFQLSNHLTDEVLVHTNGSSFVMFDKYIQLDLQLPSQRIYGLGERNREFTLSEGTWTMWANGQETPYDDGSGSKQTYGVHPFALVQTKTKSQFMGIFFRNSNAMSPIITYKDGGESTLSYISTGGTVEIYFMLKGTAKDIIKQYQNMIGKAELPPFWALGWHSSAYAYKNQSMIEKNVEGYKNASIPLEGVWLDIPYMADFADFTVDSVNFPNMTNYTKEIQSQGLRLIPIIDAGISADLQGNEYYVTAKQNNLLIKSLIKPDTKYGGAAVMKVWPNNTVFLDWFNDEVVNVWNQGLKDLYEQIPFDGLWLDMNEVTGFCDGECPDGNFTPTAKNELKDTQWYQSYPNQGNNSTYELPFIPSSKWNLDNMTLSLNSSHPSNGYIQFDTHSLNGLLEGWRTRNFLTNSSAHSKSDDRTFLLSRSTFAGSGRFTQHWLGDNHRTYADMKHSIAGVMNFNMFGIHLVGPDTCGFFGSEGQDEICGRWIQLATFYPFARQHRDDSGGGGANEPYNLAEPYQSMARNALYNRLEYVRQMYTCMYQAKRDAETCFDPLFFHFPEDDETYKPDQTEHSFIFANALKITPVLEANATKVKSYFPAGSWVNMNDYKDVVTSTGQWIDLDAPADNTTLINTHLMPGTFVIKQDNSAKKYKTTYDLMSTKAPIQLIINRDENGNAEGKVFLDDGISISALEGNQNEYYTMSISTHSVGVIKKFEEHSPVSSGIELEAVIFTNADNLQEIDFACWREKDNLQTTDLNITTDGPNKLLILTTQDGSTIDMTKFRDIYFGNSGRDINLCNPATSYYKIKDGETLDLSASTAKVGLTSLSGSTALPDLELSLTYLKTGVVNVHWTFAAQQDGMKVPFEVPTSIIDPNITDVSADPLSDVVTQGSGTAGSLVLNILNAKGGSPIYTLNGMVLGEYLNMIDGTIMAKKDPGFQGVLGLSERTSSNLFLSDGVYSLWSRDIPNPVETGKAPGNNLYGTHPLLMGQDDSSKWFGMFTNLAAAQDWWILNDRATGHVNHTTIASGGVGDMFFMVGQTPDEVTKLYHTIVGNPVLIPQWALGWNQCRWGYKNTEDLRAVVKGYEDANIPYDTQWSDIDYMDNYKDFTYDKVNYPDLKDFIEELHNKSMRYIPIIDAGVAKRDNEGYTAYEDGVKQGVFMKAANDEIFVGQVWPGDAVFPDWFGNNTAEWWKDQLTAMHAQVPFDGVWLDMNEASNFCDGVCYPDQKAKSPVQYQLPYNPSARDLEAHAISLDASHANGYLELDVHSLFGTMEVKATHEWFQQQNQRTMIIERSAYAGMGKFGSRWLGDNFSQDQYMGFSVTGIMAHNIMGITLAGSDICGFLGDTNNELCARWHTVGAFYPFSRNHNDIQSIPQEPYIAQFNNTYYKGTVTYTQIMRNSILVKYSMVRYYYTQIMKAHLEGGAFYKPLFFEFPGDLNAFYDQEQNIMLGSALKLGVAVKTNQNETDFYYPAGRWCPVFTTAVYDCQTTDGTKNITSSSFAYEFNLDLREGYMIPFQDTKNISFSTSVDLQKKPVDFLVLGKDNTTHYVANGEYINDNGVDLELKYNRYALEYAGLNDASVLTFTVTLVVDSGDHINMNDFLGKISILDATTQGVNKNYQVTPTYVDGRQVDPVPAVYNSSTDRLEFQAPESQVDAWWINEISSLQFVPSA